MKETELKPCPFCGNEKLKLDRKSKFVGYNGLDMRVEQHTYSVRCNVCHARGGAVGGKVMFGSSIFGKDISPSWATTDVELKEKAIVAWNRRADNKQEWISVDERLPDEDVRVLVWLKEPSAILRCVQFDTDRIVDGHWVRWNNHITHWMPLPQPPKMKGGAE